MSTCWIHRLLTSTIGAALAIGTVSGFGEVALAQNGPLDLPAANLNPPPSSNIQPVKVPEPATLAGLGLVAGSLAVTRRRQTKTKV